MSVNVYVEHVPQSGPRGADGRRTTKPQIRIEDESYCDDPDDPTGAAIVVDEQDAISLAIALIQATPAEVFPDADFMDGPVHVAGHAVHDLSRAMLDLSRDDRLAVLDALRDELFSDGYDEHGPVITEQNREESISLALALIRAAVRK